MLTFFTPVAAAMLSTGGGSADSLTQILAMATELFTWLITQMGALIKFLLANPFVLIPFIIVICGLIIGYFGRVWGSVR